MIKGKYKLIYCFGYPKVQNEIIHLFDIESDPEELTDLSSSVSKVAGEMLAELKSKLAEVNKPYQQAGKKETNAALL
jgi:Holliday junction resolvasome RuvABC DNA-binding subunit